MVVGTVQPQSDKFVDVLLHTDRQLRTTTTITVNTVKKNKGQQ